MGYDKEGNIYLMVSERSDTAKVIIERTIQKYSPQGQLLGIALLPDVEEFSAHRPVQILDNGTILYLDVKSTNSKILELDISKKSYNSTIISKEINQKAIENEEKLKETFSIMHAPGGYDSITTKSDGASWSNFTSAISSNAFAGNINTSGVYVPKTAGLDCSGYVAACTGDYFSLKPNIIYWANAGVLNNSSPQYMDIYVKSGTRVLFFNNHLSDISGISSLESTTTGVAKCKVYSWTWSALSGYKCRSLW